jgi:SAM-dependent methyltransferase
MRTNQETDNTEKYERGGVEGRLLARFRDVLCAEVARLAPAAAAGGAAPAAGGPFRVLDAGCGEGAATAWLAETLPGAALTGVEARADARAAFAVALPQATVVDGDVYALPFARGAFDLAAMTEVLEHLERPEAALRELARVAAGGHVLVTVPWEPWFRLGNLARGRYVARLGSTPGHLSTWGPRGLRRTIDRAAVARGPVTWRGAFPWQLAVVPV